MRSALQYMRTLYKFALLGLLVGLVCGVVNCPIASVLLSMELFGGAGLPLFALVCAVSFGCSGRHSFYSAQSFRFDKASI